MTRSESRARRWNCAFAGIALASALVHGGASAAATATACQSDSTNELVVELFIRGDKQQSRDALEYAAQLDERPGIRVKSYDIRQDPQALARLRQLAQQFKLDKAGVPTFYLCDRLLSGFSQEYTVPRIDKYLTIRIFGREGCPHCHDAETFLNGLARRWPALQVTYLDAVADPAAGDEFRGVVREYGTQPATFPVIEAAGRLIAGYESDTITGSQIEAFYRDRAPHDDAAAPASDASRPLASGAHSASALQAAASLPLAAWRVAPIALAGVDKTTRAR